MHQRCYAATALFVALAVTAAITWLAGCDSQPAAATAGTSAPANNVNPTISTAASSSAAKPRPKLQPGAKTKVLARAGDRAYDKTFDDLRFDMTVGETFRRSMLTKEIEALGGQRIRIRGYILPTPQRSGIKQFVLVRDNQECCFGPGAALYDCILVELKPGKSAEYSIRPVAVDGTFNIREFVLGGKHMAIYQMDADSVTGG
jgi:hypothetical protein